MRTLLCCFLCLISPAAATATEAPGESNSKKPGQDLVWAASVASAHEEVADILADRHLSRMTVEYAERWSVWVVTFFDDDRSVATVSVNQEGQVVEIDRGSQFEDEIDEERIEREQQRRNLLRELESARATDNRAEVREILELLEHLEWQLREGSREPERRDVDFEPQDSTLPAYILNLPEDGIERMKRSVMEEINVRGEFRLDGHVYPVEIRLRGASTRHAVKKSYRLKFLDQTPLSRKVTHLKAEPMDYTMQQEKLSCDLFQAAGLPVSECRYVNVFINGSYEGVYLDIEPVRSPFKEREGLSPKGTLIRARTFQHAQEQGPIGDLRGDVGSLEELHQFIQHLNRVGRDEFETFVRSKTDWPRVRDYLAMQVICHRSEIEADDYLFYRDPESRKWSLIPRDHNNGNFAVAPNRPRIAEPTISIFPQTIQDIGWRPPHWFVLPSRIFNNPALRNDYLNRLEALTQQHLLSDLVTERINANFNELLHAFPLDPYRRSWDGAQDPFLDTAKKLNRFAKQHGRRILELIERDRNRKKSALRIAAAGQRGDAAWVTMHNGGPRSIRLDEYILGTKDEQGQNRSLRLKGRLDPDEKKTFQLNHTRESNLGPFRLASGLVVLATSAQTEAEPERRREEIMDFLYLDRVESSKGDRP